MFPPKRIHVCGTSGSGKSTLAERYATLIGGDHVELDALWHRENWTEIPVDEFRSLVAERVKGDRWAIDGNYSKVRDLIWEQVDLVIYLDYPLPLVLWQLTKRTFRRWHRKELLWGTNRESLWRHFCVPKDSLYWWVLTTYRRRRREYRELSSDPANSHIPFLIFKRRQEVEGWLETVRSHLEISPTPKR